MPVSASDELGHDLEHELEQETVGPADLVPDPPARPGPPRHDASATGAAASGRAAASGAPGAPATPAAPAASVAPGAGLTMFELARLEEARRRAAEVEASLRASATVSATARRPSAWLSGAALVGAIAAVLAFFRPGADPAPSPEELAALRRAAGGPTAADRAPAPEVRTVSAGYGRSRSVLVRVAMPGQIIESPVAMPDVQPAANAAAERFTYQWVRAADSTEADVPRPLAGSALLAPAQPGLYRLAVARGGTQRIVDELTIAVLVPFGQKLGGSVNGYRLGSWPFERLGGERPLGFIEVTERTRDLRVSRHLRLRDFLTHDAQRQWPRYVVVSPRLLDKLELIVAEIARLRGVRDPGFVRVSVHSGFRTPLHNSGVEGSALNSRHQYGDAADVAIDADGDGRFSSFDGRVVALAAEMVERRHPELIGGIGVYLNGSSPYVHVDARGRKARWWR